MNVGNRFCVWYQTNIRSERMFFPRGRDSQATKLKNTCGGLQNLDTVLWCEVFR